MQQICKGFSGFIDLSIEFRANATITAQIANKVGETVDQHPDGHIRGKRWLGRAPVMVY